MEKRRFGKTGLEVSVLGFGGAPVGYLETEQKRINDILSLLLDQGVNLIDTAAGYRGSEESIGQAISERRQDFVLVSKCGDPGNPRGEPWTASLIGQSIDRSLQRLRTSYVDVMLLHSCDLETLRQGDALGALVQARTEGKARFIGYSGDNETAAYAAGLPEIDVVQTSINLCDQANIDRVLPLARKNDVGIMAKRPIANAAWKDPSQQPGLYADYAKTYTQRLARMGLKPADLGVEGDPAQAWSELALRFTLSQDGVHTAIIGTTNPAHAQANIAAAARGPLPATAIRTIRDAFRRAEAESGETWAGQT